MKILFASAGGDELTRRINLREIDKKTPHWDHPMKGLFQCAAEMEKLNGDILQLPKKMREKYAVCLTALALIKDTEADWWTAFPSVEAPDGYVMTLTQDSKKRYQGHMRGIEIVENRNSPAEMQSEITKKMRDKFYDENYALVCLVLTPSLFDFVDLSKFLCTLESKLKHVFTIFPGAHLTEIEGMSDQQIQNTYTLVQLVPKYEYVSFQSTTFMEDFNDRYNLGQESRIIRDGALYFATSNPVYKTT